MLTGILALLAWRLLAVQASDLAAAAPVAVVSNPDAATPDTQLAADLHTLMAEACVYREDQLTIGGQAARLGVPKYRLRRLINQRLGHRNFNAFVNRWRLDEAQQVLLNPLRTQQSVLTIALTTGFQSIGLLNRAFKAHTGLTPTGFRRQAAASGKPGLAES